MAGTYRGSCSFALDAGKQTHCDSQAEKHGGHFRFKGGHVMQPASRSMQSAELVENDFVLGWFAKAVDTLAQEIAAA